MGHRILLAGLLVTMAIPVLAAEPSAGESTLVFDLATEDALTEEHTADLLWNLNTDNIVAERVESLTGWNSLYLQEPQTVAGTVVVDLDARTITGEISERWRCNNDCVAAQGTPSWTTTRDTGWTATITDGFVESHNDLWVISGSVAIRYHADVTAIESPSDCGGSPCYVCQDRLCRVAGEDSGSAPLEGWIDGDTLSLAFADRLEADASAMDLSGLRTTEFFMSRFSITITGALAPTVAEPPPDEPTEEQANPEETTAVDQTSEADLPAGQIIPGVDAGSPPGDFGGDAAPNQAATTGATTKPQVDARTLIAIVVLILSGTAAVLIIGFLIRKLMGWDNYSAAVDAASGEGLNVPEDAGQSHWTVLDQASQQLSEAQPAAADRQPSIAATPSEHYAGRPGLKSGRYRWVEFTKPVYLERQTSGGNVELLTTKFTGVQLVGDPYPANPEYTPVFSNDGKEIGFVKTSDVPR